MIDYYLSFENETAALGILLTANVMMDYEGEIIARPGFAADLIGAHIRKEVLRDGDALPAGASLQQEGGVDFAVFPPTPYLVNVRAADAVTDEDFLADCLPAPPQYPVRVWA